MTETMIYWPPNIAGSLGVRLATGILQATLRTRDESIVVEEAYQALDYGPRPEMPAIMEIFDRRTFGTALASLQPFWLVSEDNGEDGPGPDYRIEVDTPGGRVMVGHGYGPVRPPAAPPAAEAFRVPGVFRGVDLGAGQVALFVDRGRAYVQAGMLRLPVALGDAPTWACVSAHALAEGVLFLEDGSVADDGGRLVGVWAGDRHVLPV